MGTFPKSYDTIKADMLFNKDKFRLPGSRVWYTVTKEPYIEGTKGNEMVYIETISPTRSRKTIRVPLGSNVITNKP